MFHHSPSFRLFSQHALRWRFLLFAALRIRGSKTAAVTLRCFVQCLRKHMYTRYEIIFPSPEIVNSLHYVFWSVCVQLLQKWNCKSVMRYQTGALGEGGETKKDDCWRTWWTTHLRNGKRSQNTAPPQNTYQVHIKLTRFSYGTCLGDWRNNELKNIQHDAIGIIRIWYQITTL